MNIEENIDAYLALRKQREALKSRFDVEDTALKNQMALLETIFVDACKAAGATSISTKAGVVMYKERRRYWTTDWEEFYKFVGENDAYHLLEKRIHQTNFSEFMSSEPGNVPSGLRIDVEDVATVRTK